MSKIFWNAFCFAAIVVSLIIYACANRGYPEGGIKDEIPPKVIKEEPVSFSTDFKAKRVSIYFDEFVQLKEINNKFVMSPPAKKNPKVSLRGKYIVVDLNADTLKPNTTYTLDFADAIVDNNEGNPLGYYRYVFSTGNTIDSLELSGKVIDAQTQLPLLNAMVLFYENHADSAAILELPSYLARTDSAGMFRVTNIKDTVYRVLAIEDANRDNKFTPENDRVAFVDTLVRPVMSRVMRWDTIRPDTTQIEVRRSRKGELSVKQLTKDTIVQREYILYGPSNLFMSMFEEEPTQLYLDNELRDERERLDFLFSIPGDNQLKARLLGMHLLDGVDKDWYITERSAGNDTLKLWIKDSSIYKIDSLLVELTYMRTDSLRRLVWTKDTVKLNYKDKVLPKKKKKKDDEEEDKPELKFLEFTSNIAPTFDLNRNIVLDFDKPIRPSEMEKIKLFEKVDSNWVTIPFEISQDSLKIRRFYLDNKWKPETEYQLTIDSMAMHNLYGLYNKKFEKTFKTKAEEDYGKIFLNVTGVEMPVVVQLYQGSDKDLKILQEKQVFKDGRVTFDYLNEGTYMIRAIMDRNGNGKWDTGNYLKRIQPEEIKYLPLDFKIKRNFDVEQEFDVKKTYVREDPSKKKNEEENNKKRGRSR